MPPGAVYVGRPTKWGNPFHVGAPDEDGRVMDSEATVARYRTYLQRRRDLDIAELRGKNLVCWCRLDAPCHADVLLELANRK